MTLIAQERAVIEAREDGYEPPKPISHIYPYPTLKEEAYYGVIGDIVRRIEPETEAHPAGILFGFITAAGNMIGPSPHMKVGADRHNLILNAITVGESSKARKGHGRSYSRLICGLADPEWAPRIVSGHASGESIIDDLLPTDQPADGSDDPDDIRHGMTIPIGDPRLYIMEGEFSRVLKVAERKGSILGDMIRNAWDGVPLANRRTSESRRQKKVVDRHHVSIVGDITVGELYQELTETNAINGFGNRFLWVLVRRTKRLPLGGNLKDPDFQDMGRQLRQAVNAARNVSEMRFTPAAVEKWTDWYMSLPEGSGLFHTVTARNEANTLRIAMTFAALDGEPAIDIHHLEAAFAVWDYARDSAFWLFGKTTGDIYADRIIEAAKRAGDQGLSHSQIREEVVASNNVSAQRIRDAIQKGIDGDFLWETKVSTGGRPVEVVLHRDEPTCRRLGGV